MTSKLGCPLSTGLDPEFQPLVAVHSRSSLSGRPTPRALRGRLASGGVPLRFDVRQHLHDLPPALLVEMLDRLPNARGHVAFHAPNAGDARIAQDRDDPRQAGERLGRYRPVGVVPMAT